MPMARPTSLSLSAGASLVPSPVTATTSPSFFSVCTSTYLSRGEERASTCSLGSSGSSSSSGMVRKSGPSSASPSSAPHRQLAERVRAAGPPKETTPLVLSTKNASSASARIPPASGAGLAARRRTREDAALAGDVLGGVDVVPGDHAYGDARALAGGHRVGHLLAHGVLHGGGHGSLNGPAKTPTQQHDGDYNFNGCGMRASMPIASFSLHLP
jgi:hypothetical protein